MKKNKYEYLLNTWGGFYNKEYQDKHGFKEGDYFFDTREELDTYLNNLKRISEELNAHVLMYIIKEGYDVRYHTIAKMKFLYEGKEYDYEYDFGAGDRNIISIMAI